MIYYCGLEADGDVGGYTVIFPDIPGCITEGDDLKHALEMAKEALEGVFKCYLDDHYFIPEPTNYSGQENYYPIEVDEGIAQRILESKEILKKVSV